MSLDDLHLTVIKIGSLAFTVLFIVRVCVNEVRKMKPRQRQKGAGK
jgi:hypothetical protein